MKEPLRILHLEDSPRDAELVTDELESAGIQADIVHVRDADQFHERLEETAFDAVLCDYNIPGYDGLSALALARTKQPGVPVIMVSGSLGEEEAVRCLHGGAADYLLKDRLPTAVTRAIEHARAIARQNLEAEARRELEMRFARFAEQSDDVFWFISVAPERIVYVSPAVEKIWGLPPDVHYRDSRIWIETIHPQDRARVAEAFEAFLRGEATYWVEYRVQRQDGSERHVIDRGTLIRDDGGAITGASGVVQDVTERRYLEEQFRQAQKLEAIGRLAGGIAHDFNNVLTVISGFTEFVDQQLGPDHPCHADLHEVRNAAENAARLTRQLLAFSRKQMIRPVVMNLNETLQHNAAMLRRLVGEDVKVVVRTSASPLMIKADPGQIDQVLMNLTVNARDAMPDGGVLTIETASERLDAVHNAVDPLVEPGEYARLIVSDTGHGMPPEVLKNLFEPFFTTKGPDKGTGLGLSTVYGIVRQSGGAIHVASRPGAGAAFTVYLPLASEAKATPGPPEPKRGRQHTANETILLVEDQEALLEVAARTLERAGYRVVKARTPSEAIARMADHAHAVRLVLSDVILPEMNGPALVERLLALRPDLQVLYMSGYTHDALSRIHSLNDGVELLDKPFTPFKLLETVGRILDSGPSSNDGAAGPR